MTFTRVRLTKCFVNSLIAVLSLTLLASAESKEKVLYSFRGGTDDGEYPAGGVVFDKAGNLYGATTDGGGECPPAQCGTVFRLAPPAKEGDPWTQTVLYIFKGNGSGDGNTPAGSVIIDAAGNLYGTTGYGGTGNCVLLGTKVGCGTVYELSPPTEKGGPWIETVLYSFPTSKQGYLPNGNLVFDSAGNLYGSTMFGGGYGTSCDAFYQYCGAVFELSPPKKHGGKWTEKVLHGFKGMKAGSSTGDGANPNGGLVFDRHGSIYGTTYTGGYKNLGTVFSLTPPARKGGKWTEAVLHRFYQKAGDGAEPTTGVIFDAEGALYGTTKSGGDDSGEGTVFRLTSGSDGSWTERVLHSFGTDGYQPQSGLLIDAKGDMYGTASGGGTSRGGTFFRLDRSTGGEGWQCIILYNFTGDPDAAYPIGSLVFGNNGDIFGVSQLGGSGQNCGNGNCGTVFAIEP
ncbi:MAG: choice-of-anchor tandem repeat GloVer-containing protein [Terriglobales bacterium]